MKLLIIGAGMCGLVAKEIAESMQCFERIAFVDDNRKENQEGIEIVGTIKDVEKLITVYDNVIVAIGNAQVRMALLQKLQTLSCKIISLISPKAYVASSAEVGAGCIIEPMAVVHTKAKVLPGCIISAGAVVNHAGVCEEGVHVDCNATVTGGAVVPAGAKISSGQVFS